jgi:hypothetical protein
MNIALAAKPLLPVLLVGVLLGAAAGCGPADAPDDGAATESVPPHDDTTPTPNPTPTPSPTPATTPPASPRTTPPSEALQKVRVVGELVSVGECVSVRDDNGITWTLRGGAMDGLSLGERVQVTGAPDLSGDGCGGPLVKVQALRVLG